MNIGAIIVTYNPILGALADNISTYNASVDKLIIVDNSDQLSVKYNLFDYSAKHNYIYVDMCGNKGIACALNRGMETALQYGCTWILTMDQDSYFQTNINGFLDYIACSENTRRLLFLAPSYSYNKHVPNVNENVLSRKFIWQSGCLVNAISYLELGPYLEKLFIDYVDYEYCLRAQQKGYKYFQLGTVILRHTPGESQMASVLGVKYSYHSSSHIRHYYYVRNGLYVTFKYGSLRCLYFLIKSTTKVLLIESDKKMKFFYMYKGLCDFFFNKYGCLNHY